MDRRATSAQAAFRVPFSIVDAFVAIAAYFVGQLVSGVILVLVAALVGGLDPADMGADTTLAIVIVTQFVGIGFAAGYLAARRRLSWRLLGPVRPGLLALALGLAVGIGGTIAAYTLNFVLALLFDPQDPVEQQLLDQLFEGGLATVLAVFVAVILAPLFEEILFRGLLFQALRRRMGVWPAALLSALLFAAIHVEVIVSQPLALAGLFTLGVLFAWALHRTGSLVVPVVAHALFNAVALGLAVLIEDLDLDTLGRAGIALVGG